MRRTPAVDPHRFSAASLVTSFTRALFVVAVVIMATRAVGYLTDAPNGVGLTAALLIIMYLAWLGAEVSVTFRGPTQPVAELRTIAAYASSRMVVVMAAVLPEVPWSTWFAWMVFPAVLLAVGILLRLAAIRALGARYTHHVVKAEVLVTTGPYRFLRHPAYAGMLLANLGFVAFFLNVASVVALLLLVAVVVWRILTEERVLWSVPGYPDFARGRARLLMGVW